MQTAAAMKEYFASIGLTLIESLIEDDFDGKKKVWLLGPTANLWEDFANTGLFVHFRSLRDVERGWRCTAASLYAQIEAMQGLLKMYRTSSSAELDNIIEWAEGLALKGIGIPSMSTEFRSSKVPEWLSILVRNETYWTFGEDLSDEVEDFPKPQLPHHWKKDVARLYVRYYLKNGSPNRGLLYQRITWLCKRACRARLQALPKSNVVTQEPKRL